MRFILATGWEDGVTDLTKQLVSRLGEGKKVLWLVSGGSNIAASVQAMDTILPELTRSLTILPVDERYGPEGHADSNFAGLMRAGLDTKNATTLRVLQGEKTFEQTAERYEQITAKALGENDVVLAQLGLGADGHTAGILPGSLAAREQKALVAGYKDERFNRLTLTFPTK
jgi:6-phosphogluconolactonase/glucosamine-6-phosphate isomerase/deaminase